MPLVGSVLGSLLGLALGLTTGGVMLLALLAASASYIAVPAADAHLPAPGQPDPGHWPHHSGYPLFRSMFWSVWPLYWQLAETLHSALTGG